MAKKSWEKMEEAQKKSKRGGKNMYQLRIDEEVYGGRKKERVSGEFTGREVVEKIKKAMRRISKGKAPRESRLDIDITYEGLK